MRGRQKIHRSDGTVRQQVWAKAQVWAEARELEWDLGLHIGACTTPHTPRRHPQGTGQCRHPESLQGSRWVMDLAQGLAQELVALGLVGLVGLD
jgi:hypothetical protein